MADGASVPILFMNMLVRAFAVTAIFLTLLHCAPADAQDSPGLIRDAEIETDIRQWVTPIFGAAGLDPSFVQIYLVNDPQINSFVAGGQRVFINTGLLTRAESANEIIGVIAHESGHIAGGHLLRMQEALSDAKAQAVIGFLLGGAAAVLGKNGEIAGAGMMAGQSMAERSLFAYSINQEERADQAALNFLDTTHQSARGLLHLFEVLSSEEALLPGSQDPYLRTHPLTQSRIDHMREHIAHSPYSDAKDPPDWVVQQRRIVAKLNGFLLAPGDALAYYPETDKSLYARYARAIAYHRVPMDARANAEIDSLLKEAPKDPYFNELKGQIAFEGGHVAEAVGPYRKAVELVPDNALMKVELAQVLLEADDSREKAIEATKLLKLSIRTDDTNPDTWHFLGIAEGRTGAVGEAAVDLAQEALLAGDRKTARMHARRAEQLLPRGSAGWLRADDIARAVHSDKDKDSDG